MTRPGGRRRPLNVELGEGPCLEAARSGVRVLVPDLGGPDAVERFPRFAPAATASGVAAVFSFPFRTLDHQVGSVALFNAAGARGYQRASGFVTVAQQRLADAAVLEQAKGRLGVQLEVQPDHAFADLRRHVLATGGSLRQAAEQIAGGGPRLRRTADGSITRE